MGEFAVCLPRAPAWKSREIDSMPPAGRFDSKPRQGSRAVARKRRGLPHTIDAFRPGKCRVPIVFRRFFALLGAFQRR